MQRASKGSMQTDRPQAGQSQGQKQQSGGLTAKPQGQKPKGKAPEKKQDDTSQTDKSRSWKSNRPQTGGAATTTRSTRPRTVVCYRCNKSGHYASVCPDNPDNKKKEKDPKNPKPQ